LNPCGRLVAQCRGEGNISRATRATKETMKEERFSDYFVCWHDDKYNADAGTTAKRLEAAGFEEVQTWLHDEIAAFDSVDELARFVGTIVLGGHLKELPEEEQLPFAARVAEKVAGVDGRPALDYVRLNMMARRSA
jgi:trans-aconitate 2-methyltransferase